MLHPKIKNGIRDILMNIGFKPYFFKHNNEARVLLFHGIDDIGNTSYNSRYISISNFDALLKYCKQYFHIATLEDFCKGNYPKDQFTITITFDDGLANNYYKALPVLEKYQLPASFFLTGIRKYKYDYLWTDFIDLFLYKKNEIVLNNISYKKSSNAVFVSNDGTSVKSFLRTLSFEEIYLAMEELVAKYKFDIHQLPTDYFLQMTEEEIKKMSSHPLFTIGSHGMCHTDLTKISLIEAEQEIIESKNYLENITGKEINAFAFPFDIYNQELIKITKKTGYKFILPYLLQKGEDTSVQRFGINPYISLNNQIHFIHKGNYA